jgi:hypothetical protein
MMFKKKLTLVLLASSFFGILVSSTRVEVFATTTTIQTNFLDLSAVWLNKSNQGDNSSFTDSPYRITNTIDGAPYQFLMSVGAYVTGDPAKGRVDRIIFGSFVTTVTSHYNLTHNAALSPFAALTTATYPAVIVLNQDVTFKQITSMSYAYSLGTSGDTHTITPIYSINQGVSWQRSPFSNTFTTSGSSNTISFNSLSHESVLLRVGFLFENTNNTNALNMTNPALMFTFEDMDDEAQANAFASLIEDYSPCATIENGMTQLTLEKQNELNDLYDQLSAQAKIDLQSIPMGIGFNAADRYLYLINSPL